MTACNHCSQNAALSHKINKTMQYNRSLVVTPSIQNSITFLYCWMLRFANSLRMDCILTSSSMLFFFPPMLFLLFSYILRRRWGTRIWFRLNIYKWPWLLGPCGVHIILRHSIPRWTQCIPTVAVTPSNREFNSSQYVVNLCIEIVLYWVPPRNVDLTY